MNSPPAKPPGPSRSRSKSKGEAPAHGTLADLHPLKTQMGGSRTPRDSPRFMESNGSEDGYFNYKRASPTAKASSPTYPPPTRDPLDAESGRARAASGLKRFDSIESSSSSGHSSLSSQPTRPQSPSRAPSNTYAPLRTPSSSNLGGVNRSQRSSKSTGSGQGETSSHGQFEDRKKQAQYLAQEKIYLQKIRNDLWDDYYVKGVQPAPASMNESALDVDSDDDSVSDATGEVAGFGGVGTSFDDEYAEIGSSYPLLETSYSREDIDGNPELKERLEWQSMLSSVLTGEVFRSEKKRLRAPEKGSGFNAEELWVSLRAKVCGRGVAEQKRVLEMARTTVQEQMDKIRQFKLNYDGSHAGMLEASRQVTKVLDQYVACVALYPNIGVMNEQFKIAQEPSLQRRIDALIAWDSITRSINLELDLLRSWTGNYEIDPVRKPTPKDPNDKMDEQGSLVENVLKQDDLKRIFEYRIRRRIGPLIVRARETTIEFSETFVDLGLPLFHAGLSTLMAFPVKLIQEIIRMRMSYARKLANPTMVIIDQMIDNFQNYIRIALTAVQRNAEYSAPVLDKGWTYPNLIDKSFDTILLDCVGFYLELFHKKIMENGRSSKLAAPVAFRAFKDGEQLEQQYAFLRDVSKFIDGGDVLVAREFSSLNTKMLARLLTYWEGQIDGPPHMTSTEIEKWYSATMGNVRSMQRRLLRFYRIHTEAYENSTEYAIQQNRIKNFMTKLRGSGHFLVLTSAFEQFGIYAIADPSLRRQPEKIKSIITGYCRPDVLQSQNGEVPYVLIFCIQEPLVWEGEIYNLDVPYFDVDIKPGRLRLVSGGGRLELNLARKELSDICGGNDFFEVVVDAKSHLQKVDHELNKVRRLIFRLSISVMNGVQSIRHKCKPYGCQETVNNLFVFAREFSQRGISVMEPNRRGAVAIRLINICIEWVSFVCDDCVPTEYKTFRWTVVALEFAMVMTRGVNIVAISSEQFTKLRLKVAESMSLLISHFDIMGARSKAAEEDNQDKEMRRRIANGGPTSAIQLLETDESIMSTSQQQTLRSIETLEDQRESLHSLGKVLDDTNADSQFLTFLASSFSNVTIRWQQGRFIGGGTFGAVYQAVNLDTGKVMAVKEIRLQDTQSIRHILKSIKDEMTVLEILDHPNVVQYHGVEVHRDKVFIFMDYCEGGSLAGLLEYGRIEDEQVIQIYTLQMLEGLAYLHQSGIVHRDIKPANILLDHNGVVKFVDFGAAKVIARTGKTRQPAHASSSDAGIPIGVKTKLNSMTGTPMYMSPEAITGSDTGRAGAIDIWSLGCCVLEMATGKSPWVNLDNEWAIMYRIAAGHLPNLPSSEQLSNEGKAFLIRCLEQDPKKRPSAMELLNDPWIVSIRNIMFGSFTPSDEISSPASSVTSPLTASSPLMQTQAMYSHISPPATVNALSPEISKDPVEGSG